MTVLALIAALAAADSNKAAIGPLRAPAIETQDITAPEPDAWLGSDKFRHFAISYAITAFGFAGARAVFDPDASLAMAMTAAATAGVLKEIHDHAQGRPFSKRDLVWDAAGIALGYFIVRQTSWK